MLQTVEPILIQAFIPEPTIECFDVRVLVELARFDEEQLNTSGVRPCQHGSTAEFFPVIGSDCLGQASGAGKLF